ncbi:hypothetical protein LX36DRAFT_689250 [Colletotrichum falcatum]|nr:hypothetical protein LX36DRAFT_689250 [Colletotrichum falcatum]
MAIVRRGRIQPVLWAMLLCHLFLLGFSLSECSCEILSATPNIFNNGSSSSCPCSQGKVTLIPVTFTTVFTIYDPVSSESLVSTPGLFSPPSASHTGASQTITLGSIGGDEGGGDEGGGDGDDGDDDGDDSDSEDSNDGDDDSEGGDGDDDSSNDVDEGDDDDDDDDDDGSFLDGFRIDLGVNFGIDLGFGFGTSILGNALRDIFGFGMSTGFGTNTPSGGGGGNGETEPEEPKESVTTSKSTSSCSPCVVSQIKSLGTSSYTTSCATATCRTTQVCTSIRTTTATSFTTKRPERTAACMPKRCPACQQDPPGASSKELGARWGSGDEAILKDTITEPETWARGEHDWWERMRRVVKTYGPGLHIGSTERMDSSSSWNPFINLPQGGGAGPVWGCAVVVAFSPRGVYASQLWEVPNFGVAAEDEEYFDISDGVDVDYYFKQNVEASLQEGSADYPHQEQYPALAPLVDAGGPLHPEDSGFFRTIVFVPTHDNGEIFYKSANRRLLDFLSDKVKIDKKYITIYGYRTRMDLGKDFDYDGGVATPPPDIRAANPWDGLFSWLELVVRYEKSVIHREAWCGSGRADPDAPPSNFELRPKPDRPPAGLRPVPLRPRQEETATCGRFVLCGLGGPEGICGDYRKHPPPALSGQPQKRQLRPANGPSRAERDLSTDLMIDPKDAAYGEVWWWDRMRNINWATSALVMLDQEVDGTATDRPRFGGSGPIWGCSAIIVASSEAVWTSQIWEIPSHSRGEGHGRGAFDFWKQHYPRPTVEYFREGFLDFIQDGNTKGSFKQQYGQKFPGRNPRPKDMFAEKGAFNVKEKEFVWVGIVTRSYKNLAMPRVQYDWKIQQVYEMFVAWGVDPKNIMVKAYPARMDFAVGGPQIPPHWGILSWQYHPSHREAGHEERKLRIRFEKELLWEKSWCGSGAATAGPGGKAPTRRREDYIEACKMVVSSRESASATKVETAASPEPTLACISNAACGSLSCPENRISACHHGFCRCDPPGNNCTVKEDCSSIKCPYSQRPDCGVKGGPKPGCHCFDKPKKLLDACSSASDCVQIGCEARHEPACRAPIDSSPGAASARPASWTHCNGLPCDAANKRGFCRSNACRCDFFLSEGAGCSTHDDCSPIRCSEAKPHKTCSAPSNACVCKTCTARFKILGCGSDDDCNHCCARGRLPGCVMGCRSFWCGNECQCVPW